MAQAKIGLIGLAVMGENLALNIERNGFPIAVWNRDPKKVETLLETRAKGKNFIGTKSIQEFVNSLEKPRKIIMLVKAGEAVDWTVAQLKLIEVRLTCYWTDRRQLVCRKLDDRVRVAMVPNGPR